MAKTKLFLTPKMGLIPEVSAQNYETLAKALREYIANAMDASAKRVWLVFAADAENASQLDIRDDGKGMTLDELRDQFLAVGGSRKFDDPSTVGRIGIGFLAVVPFCEIITIHTKSTDSPYAVRAVINTNTMLPPGVRYEEIAKKAIGEAETLNVQETTRLVAAWGESFTAFSLTRLRADVANTFAAGDAFEAFRNELRLILPLPWPDKAPLKEHLSAGLWKELRSKAKSNSVQVYLNDTEASLTRRIYGENEEQENFLYCQEFQNEVVVPADASLEQALPIRITGFFVCNEPMPAGTERSPKLSGVVTRILNVAVDEDTFFGLEGREERKKRIAGEIFIEGLDANRAIQINRNAFTETHTPVVVLRKNMAARLNSFFSGMNRIWRARTVVNKEIKRVRSIVTGVGDALRSIGTGGPLRSAKRASRDATALMRHSRRRQFPIDPGAGLTIRATEDLAPSSRTPYRISLEGDPTSELTGVVEISKDLLDVATHSFAIGGVEFHMQVVDGTLVEPPCAINLRERFVVLNLAHPLVACGDRAVIEMLVYLAYCTEVAENPQELATQLIALMTISRGL
jgi:hypothetical protein